MSQESREALRRFEQKMRDEGSDGFADGPRPWERWDESGHQANNRVWEGSARRIYPRRRKTRSAGYRLLSVLTYLSLTTLLVGIGGVYFSHTQSQRLAQNGIQPLPATHHAVPSIAAAGSDAVMTATTSPAQDLNVLSAPAAGEPGSTQDQALAAVASAPATHEDTPVTDEPALATATAVTAAATVNTSPPASSGSIDSVAIETIVTKQSVTTTVYTRHPQQEEAEIVAAIETTPPPFAHEVIAAQPQVAGALPPAVHITNDEAMTAAASVTPPPALQAVVSADAMIDSTDDPVTASANEALLDALVNNPATAAGTETTRVALAETGGDTADTGALAETEPGASAGQRDTLPATPATEKLAAAMSVATAEMNTAIAVQESPVETAPEITATQVDSLPDNQAVQQAEAAAAVAVAETSKTITTPETLVETVPEATTTQGDALPDNSATAQAETATKVAVVDASSATAAPEVTAEQPIDTLAMITPVAKTGGWVINLASYTWKSTASRKLALFKQQGVDGEIFAITINDKPMYRIRVTGYQSSRQAKAGIPALEQALDLEGAWISRH